MRKPLRTILPVLMLVIGFVFGSAGREASAGRGDLPARQATTTQPAHTHFFNIGPFKSGRKAAAEMTRLHSEMAARGWAFSDMELYTENADLEGFFLTYVAANP